MIKGNFDAFAPVFGEEARDLKQHLAVSVAVFRRILGRESSGFHNVWQRLEHLVGRRDHLFHLQPFGERLLEFVGVFFDDECDFLDGFVVVLGFAHSFHESFSRGVLGGS